MDLRSRISPLPMHASLKMDDHVTWGASMTQTDDGTCHLFFSFWPRELGHSAWVTHSEVGYATASDPLGPYEHRGLALGRHSDDAWDGHVAHNPTIMQWAGKFYLYYTGNFGDGEYWDHRNHQRVGVAVADRPEGPWQRSDAPLLEVSPGCWDSLITTNPSCTPTPDGRFLLMYKAAGHERELPMGGPVLHGVAFSDSPTGPFVKHPEPLFKAGDATFPAEDPFVWTQDGRLFAILKDQGQYYTDETRALVLFESDDGIEWKLAEQPVVTGRKILWEDGSEVEYDRLERPQVYVEDGKPTVLFAAVKPKKDEDDSYNIHIPLL